ncbi:bifunctional diaminohydroxyphosphoribosylaminopyrimidine deaminase/5-amino-6-(5-phosphoribosylamino)uracil reductase RibD [Maritimibacter sp. 55A14]|uniref:bifunctional diaminohydroxyphosphoribosylaminopyrimidine deaminase/5-amino-6-(5-phosphoribosylamino)uracil reductase RibD n=1 Tax=Maritimibacter sp. 55A14 TaxID=2174844 RepID=UPI000D60C5EE|nr:bifunctional diaminohydroxyphosphoribosylaminopyrimidine deaminase/5-amino-6-(5-phosphoribosylamino)uracil reductase RibD [Maritimibacter sp. 55A14]PWE33285.1 bifunctional diaminohydroxyphosphoribosylaminopyrimidine deaminase/5-amino-6-(5-phosphoribosylamino)uracil reductase RibD [Maritimibacter sp. 55A14]
MSQAADARWMALALSLGARGMGKVWPNPAVGCVVVAGNRLVGRGWTQPGGRPHAETVALAQAGAAARGATAYVTLEPCAHHGVTPPCAEALAAAGVARVVTALEDPDPRVAGGGHAVLRAAGIAVETGPGEAAARHDHRGFLTRVTQGRPMLTLKLATTLDGRIATAAGESRWITGSEARRMVHALRARHDAVMVGAGTARADDPLLTVRGMGPVRQPVRIVCDTRLSLTPESRLGRSLDDAPLWICHGPEAPDAAVRAWRDAGATTLACAAGADGWLDMGDVLGKLGDAGLTRVFCEGGGTLAASLLGGGLVDELIGFTAGMALGADGRPATGPLGLSTLGEAPRFQLHASRAIGGDIMHHWVTQS